jgi:hypothetical protein
VKFVEKKRTSNTSKWWQYYHHVFVNECQQQFVSCNKCKALLSFISANGTNNLRSHFNSCKKTEENAHIVQQKTVHDFYSSSTHMQIPKQMKLSITQACTEFCALDARAFTVMKGDGFQNLAKAIFEAGRRCHKSSIDIKDIIPHPTTVRIEKYSRGFNVLFDLIFSDQSKHYSNV